MKGHSQIWVNNSSKYGFRTIKTVYICINRNVQGNRCANCADLIITHHFIEIIMLIALNMPKY